jgi:hypothetical protein
MCLRQRLQMIALVVVVSFEVEGPGFLVPRSELVFDPCITPAVQEQPSLPLDGLKRQRLQYRIASSASQGESRSSFPLLRSVPYMVLYL